MASDAGAIVDEHDGDARAIAELLVQARAAFVRRLLDTEERELAALREVDDLRARDEAATAVVQWWAIACDPDQSGEMRWDVPQEGRDALDALARAHEGGQDR